VKFGEQLRLHDVLAEADGVAPTAGQRHAVGEDERHHVVRAEFSGVEQRGQVVRLDRDGRDAAERPVGPVQAARQRDGPPAADPAEHRFRNQQALRVGGAVRLEELAVGNVGGPERGERLHHIAARVGGADEGDRRMAVEHRRHQRAQRRPRRGLFGMMLDEAQEVVEAGKQLVCTSSASARSSSLLYSAATASAISWLLR